MSNFTAFILTTTSIEERLADANSLRNALQALGVFDAVEIVPSIFWKDKGVAEQFLGEHPEHTFSDRYLERCKQGQLCCTLSHIKMWRKLLASDHAGAFVFEDDIHVTDEAYLGQVVAALEDELEIDWLRIHLHKRFRDEIQQTDSPYIFVEDPSEWGFATYFVSRRGARRLVDSFRDIDHNVDNIIPVLGKQGVLKCKTLHKVVVEHHAFEGDEAALQGRHKTELLAEKLQKSPSTIYSSPALIEDTSLFRFIAHQPRARKLRKNGFAVLKNVFDAEAVAQARSQVLKHKALLKNTRPSPSAGHLAGFHRFPELESLHAALAANGKILDFLDFVMEGDSVRTIGLSDITVNRSQQWHKDLLRGKFQSYLDDGAVHWNKASGDVLKVLLYLQDGASLKVVAGSHLEPVSLENDLYAEPGDDSRVLTVAVKAGDVVVLDIRTSHRGATEELYLSGKYDDDPRILVSTVLGRADSPMTQAMEVGNFHRLMSWVERHRDSPNL